MEKFLRVYEPLLHHNHCFILQIKQWLVEGYGRLPGYMDLTSEQLSRKIKLCQDLLNAFQVTESHLSIVKGVVYLELCQSLYQKKSKKDEVIEALNKGTLHTEHI